MYELEGQADTSDRQAPRRQCGDGEVASVDRPEGDGEDPGKQESTMKNLADILREGDPAADSELSPMQVDAMRRSVLDAARRPEVVRTPWHHPLAMATMVALMIAAGIMAGRRLAVNDVDVEVGPRPDAVLDGANRAAPATAIRDTWRNPDHLGVRSGVHNQGDPSMTCGVRHVFVIATAVALAGGAAVRAQQAQPAQPTSCAVSTDAATCAAIRAGAALCPAVCADATADSAVAA